MAKLTFSLYDETVDVHCPDTAFSSTIVYEVLDSKAYPVFTFMHDINTIVDIGAHVGAFAARFAITFPHATIHSYEPNPALRTYREANRLPNVVLYNDAISDRAGGRLLTLFEDDSVFSSFGTTLRRKIDKQIIVPTIDALTLPKKIDILKLDTEGHELPILKRLGPRLLEIPYIYVEFHTKEDRCELDRMLLKTHDLHWGSIIHSNCGEVFYLKHGAGPMDCSVGY